MVVLFRPPALEGTPGDDAGKVATIRAETDVGKLESYLADASAQIRFEALKRLTAPVTSVQVVRILREDPYAENRAAAYRALGTEAGWREIAALIPKAMPTASYALYDTAEATVLRQDHVHTFRVLADEGRALVAREWTAAKEPLTKRFLLHIAQSLTWRIERILAEAKLAMEKPRSEMAQW